MWIMNYKLSSFVFPTKTVESYKHEFYWLYRLKMQTILQQVDLCPAMVNS